MTEPTSETTDPVPARRDFASWQRLHRARREERERSGDAPPRRGSRNVFAQLALVMGICAWVPLVIVIAGPLALVFAGLALWTARRRDQRDGLDAAWWGLVLTVIAVVLHSSFALFASAFGWVGAWLGIGVGA